MGRVTISGKGIVTDRYNKLECKLNDIVFLDDKLENVNVAKSVGINAYQITGSTINDFLRKEGIKALKE